jgi:hypothetical protein
MAMIACGSTLAANPSAPAFWILPCQRKSPA